MPTQNSDGTWTDGIGQPIIGGGTGTSLPIHQDPVTIIHPTLGHIPGTMNWDRAIPND